MRHIADIYIYIFYKFTIAHFCFFESLLSARQSYRNLSHSLSLFISHHLCLSSLYPAASAWPVEAMQLDKHKQSS